MRKSFSVDNHSGTNQILDASRFLKGVLQKRAVGDSHESVIEILVNKNMMMEEGL